MRCVCVPIIKIKKWKKKPSSTLGCVGYFLTYILTSKTTTKGTKSTYTKEWTEKNAPTLVWMTAFLTLAMKSGVHKSYISHLKKKIMITIDDHPVKY